MKVLIADNVKLFQIIISNLFESSSLEPVMVETGQSALEKIENTGEFEVICLSLHLSDICGIELAKKIRRQKKYAYTPIILFTSDDTAESGAVFKEAMAAGITEVFKKQEIQQLVAFIKRFSIRQQKISGRILYIEDSLAQSLLGTSYFETMGLTVDTSETGEKGWQLFQKNEYDLVVTDIILKGNMSGISLVNRIRRMEGHKGDIPILAVTGFDDISRRIELFHLGVNDYVIKPVIKEEMIARVRNLVNEHRAVQEQINLVTRIFKTRAEAVFTISEWKKITWINTSFIKQTGYTCEDAIGQDIFWLADQDIDRQQEIWDKVDKLGSWQGKISFKQKNGKSDHNWLNLISIKSMRDDIMFYVGLFHLYRD